MGKIKQPRNPAVNRTSYWQEFQLIEWIRKLASPHIPQSDIGIGDDASAHCSSGKVLELVTCDALVEDVHWSFQWCDPESLARKAVAVNLSDIAAMGGTPKRAHLVLALPRRLSRQVIEKFMRALLKTLAGYKVVLAGGDTVASPGPMMIALTVQGSVKRKEMILRSGARIGDAILVTGDLGGPAAGLGVVNCYKKIPRNFQTLVQKLLAPAPRMAAARLLARSGKVHAMIDLSDGLAGDVRHIAQAGKVGVQLFAGQLPVSLATSMAARVLKKDPLELALRGGEDYELLFTAPRQSAWELIKSLKKQTQTPCSIIGQIVPAGRGISQIQPDGKQEPLPQSWEHNIPARGANHKKGKYPG